MCDDYETEDGLIDVSRAVTLDQLMKRHTLEEETSAEDDVERPSFFSQIQLVPIEEQI